MANVIKGDSANPMLDSLNGKSLEMHRMQNIGAYNRLSGDPYDGMLDKNAEVRLRLAMIDNPEIQRNSQDVINPLDVTNIINVNTGKVVLRWLDIPGGVIRPAESGGSWTYIANKDSQHPEERTGDEWEISSRREMVSLTHPLIWANDNNYCGLNYIPPVGSIVVVGFRKQNMPIILGYIPTHYQICHPILKPGEMVMKGYGGNYIHNRWSDKLDIKAWSEKGKVDVDDPNKKKVNTNSNTLWIRMNANDGFISLTAGNEKGNDSTLKLTPTSCEITTNSFKLNAKSVEINTDDYKLVSGGAVKINSGSDTTLNVGGNLTNQISGNITTNCTNSTINASANSNITAGGNHQVRASKIFLN